MKLAFAQWLTYDDGTDFAGSLVNGNLVPPVPSLVRTERIAKRIWWEIVSRKLWSLKQVSMSAWVQVMPLPPEPDDDARARHECLTQVRQPDVMLEREEIPDSAPNVVCADMLPPCLVVEVSDPHRDNPDRDRDPLKVDLEGWDPVSPSALRAERIRALQYLCRGVREYWWIDPDRGSVSVYSYEEDGGVGVRYRREELSGADRIASAVVPGFDMSVGDLLGGSEI